MTPGTADVPRIAAEAALAVPGVAGLHAGLRWSLAGAAYRMQALRPGSPSPESGVLARHDIRTGAWHLDVRCVLDDGRRALDTARDVRESVGSAVSSHLAGLSTPGAVSVGVDITRINVRPR